jgi:hypothetical protein
LLILITFQSFKAAFSMDIKNQMLLASILGWDSPKLKL